MNAIVKKSDRLPLGRNACAQGLLLGCLALLTLGAVMVFSSAVGDKASGSLLARREYKHIVLAVLAALIMLSGSVLDYRLLFRSKGSGATIVLMIAVSLCLLVLVPSIGVKINGARRWLRMPGMPSLTFQPSELLKMAMVLFLAWRLGREESSADMAKVTDFAGGFLPLAVLVVFCAAIVGKEDLGTGAIIAATGMAMLFMGGARWRDLLVMLVPAVCGFILLLVSNPARLRRITVFLNPWEGSPDHTWQLRQSLIALGSGGVFGKGLGAGAAKMGFLPESQTDFIFALICEELGLLGAGMLIALFVLIMLMFWRACSSCCDSRGRLLAAGLGLLFIGQAVLHIAVNTGAAPPTGVSLPMVGAGGTALLLSGLLIAMTVSVATFGRGGRT